MRYSKWIRCAVAAGLLAGWTAACDFVSPTDSNPNAVPDATIDQLFVSAQVNAWYLNEGELSWLVAVWTQQMAGTQRQFQDFDNYIGINETVAGPEWFRPYGNGENRQGGGLVDLRLAMEKADAEERTAYKGILQVHEAFLIGTAAAVWGDIPYSQAVNPDIPTPELDDQAAVYAAVQNLLDDAIDNLGSGTGEGPPGGTDMVFGGDLAAWEAVAYSLKARLYMDWAEGDAGNYTSALTAAANGIQSAAGDWNSVHTTTVVESNLWYQFMVVDRSGYISANAVMVNLLDINLNGAYNPGVDDPRLPLYFSTGSGTYDGVYIGSPTGTVPGDPNDEASQLGVVGQADYGLPLITCYETYFIIAEAEYEVGTEANAQTALGNARDCIEDFWAAKGYTIDLDPFFDTAATGPALLDEIMTQKYIAMFLNPATWGDQKRQCIPTITPAQGNSEIPARMYYPLDERETNPNIPDPGVQGPIPGSRNDNDTAGCNYPTT